MKHTNVKIILALAITVLINNLSLSDDLTQPGFGAFPANQLHLARLANTCCILKRFCQHQ